MKYLLILSFFLFVSCKSTPQKELKVVFLHGSRSHACGEHEFRAGSHLLSNHLNAQKEVKVKAIVHHGWPKNEAILDDADAVVIYANGERVIRHGWKKMDQLSKKGIGILFMHYAVHPSINNGEKYFKPWIGGYFKNGKSSNPFWGGVIKTLKGHPVANGVKETYAIDEFYMNLEYSKRMIPLGVAKLTRKNLFDINNLWNDLGYNSDGKKQALLWGFERKNGGRGAGFTGGHFHRNWAIDSYRKLILNTIIWVAGGEVPSDGVPTVKVTEKELNENLDQYGSRQKWIRIPNDKPGDYKSGNWLTPREHKKRGRKRRPHTFNNAIDLKKLKKNFYNF